MMVNSRFGIKLLHLEQPFLKAKQLFSLRNLLHNRLQESTGNNHLGAYCSLLFTILILFVTLCLLQFAQKVPFYHIFFCMLSAS